MLRLSRLPRVSLVSSSASSMTPFPTLEGELAIRWREESKILVNLLKVWNFLYIFLGTIDNEFYRISLEFLIQFTSWDWLAGQPPLSSPPYFARLVGTRTGFLQVPAFLWRLKTGSIWEAMDRGDPPKTGIRLLSPPRWGALSGRCRHWRCRWRCPRTACRTAVSAGCRDASYEPDRKIERKSHWSICTSLANLINFSLFFKIFFGKSSLIKIPVPTKVLAFWRTAFLS